MMTKALAHNEIPHDQFPILIGYTGENGGRQQSNNNNSSAPSKEIRLFVYGTLKKGYPNHGAISSAKYLGHGVLRGFRMIHLGQYPAVFKAHMDTCITHGEVFSVTEDQLKHCDFIEGHPEYYKRSGVIVEGFGLCWTYVQPKPEDNYRAIMSGQWTGPLTFAYDIPKGEFYPKTFSDHMKNPPPITQPSFWEKELKEERERKAGKDPLSIVFGDAKEAS